MAKKGTKEAADDAAPVKARVLARLHIDGIWHEPNTVVTGTAQSIQELEAQGSVDSDEDAVAYAESLKPADSAE
jgi:hypothetical protein